VSRIPDGNDAKLLAAALAAPRGSMGRTWKGVRNFWRPFADSIWAGAAPGNTLLRSEPTSARQVPALDLQGDQIYFMLHGSDTDGQRFWGERQSHAMFEAVNLQNVPALCASVIFTGCCWGALAANGIASASNPSNPPPPRTARDSMAMKYLSGGATAFIGCTGSHYSPDPPGGFFGGPMHRAFWKYLSAGKSPAAALMAAKSDYRAAMPHGQNEPEAKAIEKKILWQYTCLGLGW